jgi:hypothetical protein
LQQVQGHPSPIIYPKQKKNNYNDNYEKVAKLHFRHNSDIEIMNSAEVKSTNINTNKINFCAESDEISYNSESR